jgi:hypothetical protein
MALSGLARSDVELQARLIPAIGARTPGIAGTPAQRRTPPAHGVAASVGLVRIAPARPRQLLPGSPPEPPGRRPPESARGQTRRRPAPIGIGRVARRSRPTRMCSCNSAVTCVRSTARPSAGGTARTAGAPPATTHPAVAQLHGRIAPGLGQSPSSVPHRSGLSSILLAHSPFMRQPAPGTRHTSFVCSACARGSWPACASRRLGRWWPPCGV